MKLNFSHATEVMIAPLLPQSDETVQNKAKCKAVLLVHRENADGSQTRTTSFTCDERRDYHSS